MRMFKFEPSCELAEHDECGLDVTTRKALGMHQIIAMQGPVAFYEAVNPDTIARYKATQKVRRRKARSGSPPTTTAAGRRAGAAAGRGARRRARSR